MAEIRCNDIKMTTCQPLIHEETEAPDFSMIDIDLDTVTLAKFKDRPILIHTYPSIDTKMSFKSLTDIKERLAERKAVSLGISYDLPFTLRRTYKHDNISGIQLLSAFRDESFGQNYGVQILDGPLEGLLASAIFVLDAKHHLVYKELLTDLTQLPHYDAAISALDHSCHAE